MNDEDTDRPIMLTLPDLGGVRLTLQEALEATTELQTQVAALQRQEAHSGPVVRSLLTSEVIAMVGCLICGVPARANCLRRGGKKRTRCHAERWKAARALRDSR